VASLQSATYTVTGGLTVTAVAVEPSGKGVKLTVTGTPTGAVTVSITGAKDAEGVTIAAGTVVTANTVPLICKDIKVDTATPGTDGYMSYPTIEWVDGADAYTILAQGSDIWGAADGFNFLYEQKTGDFDVVVRQKSISHTSMWAKGGLMVRESLNADSRNWNVVNTPLASDGIMAPDNSGYGTTYVECNRRTATAGASDAWRSVSVASDYPFAWVRLQRAAGVITAFASSDGKTWTQLGQNNPANVGAMTPLPSTVYVGICTTAHNNDLVPLGPEGFLYYNQCEYADYNSSYVPVAPAAQLTAAITNGKLVISWAPAGGRLQSATALGGNWADVGTANPSSPIDMTGAAQFFRVISP